MSQATIEQRSEECPVQFSASLTSASLDALLRWLDPDRTAAAERYEQIRRALVKIFTYRGCHAAEDLADVTIDRVSRHAERLIGSYVGDPALYFYAVAKRVLADHQRSKPPVVLREPTRDGREASRESQFQCLDRCLASMSARSRDLILKYYEHRGRAKIQQRERLAHELGISENALRIRLHRVRAALERCVSACLDRLDEHLTDMEPTWTERQE